MVGCGVISSTYLRSQQQFDGFEIVACADVDPKRACARADEHGIEALPVQIMLADPTIDCVLNLTPPAAHFEIGLAAVRAGKHLYQEKPIAIELDDARTLVREAAATGVRVGSAPDTFLGAGLQTVRALLDDGRLGEPVGAHVAIANGGPERWHPDPAFLYARGAGPLLDVGPYLVTAVIALLGPIVRVTAAGRRLGDVRVVGSGPRRSEAFPVEVHTTVMALLEHHDGAITSLTTSFDIPARARPFELHGTRASVTGPDPNAFGGPVRVRTADGEHELELVEGVMEEARGIGLDDMARAIADGGAHRASGDMGLHVLEVLAAVDEAHRMCRHVSITSRVDRPPPLGGTHG